LKSLLAKASPPRAGDRLAGIAAETAEENVTAKLALADVPLAAMLAEPLTPCVDDEVMPLTFAARRCSRERANSKTAILFSDGGARKSKLSRFLTVGNLAALMRRSTMHRSHVGPLLSSSKHSPYRRRAFAPQLMFPLFGAPIRALTAVLHVIRIPIQR
jgi:hypothetical protein